MAESTASISMRFPPCQVHRKREIGRYQPRVKPRLTSFFSRRGSSAPEFEIREVSVYLNLGLKSTSLKLPPVLS